MGGHIASIDLGTSKVCVIIAEIGKNNQNQIIGLGKSKCKGIRKGVVVDIEATTTAILEAVEQAENMANIKVGQAYINLPGGYCNLINNKGVIAVSGENREISFEDIKRVLNSATIVSIPQEQEIIDIIPSQYIVDGYDEIKDPIGMVGTRLEVDADIITGSATTVLNLVKAVNRAGIEVLGILMEPLATAEAILTEDEKELGVLLIDIGAGTCDVTVFKKGRIKYSKLFTIGGNHITNDISIGLRVSLKDGEELKKKHGLTYIPMSNDNEIIQVNPIGINESIEINKLQLTQIIDARVSELLQLICNDIEKKGIKNELLTGIIITGGGISYLSGIEELGYNIFNLPIRIGQPNNIGAREPIYSTAIGIINYISKRKFNYFIEYNNVGKNYGKFKGKSSKNVVSIIKKLWNEYF